jgi:hypothetical protein
MDGIIYDSEVHAAINKIPFAMKRNAPIALFISFLSPLFEATINDKLSLLAFLRLSIIFIFFVFAYV